MRRVENTGVSLDPLYRIDFLVIGEFSSDALDDSAIRQNKNKTNKLNMHTVDSFKLKQLYNSCQFVKNNIYILNNR